MALQSFVGLALDVVVVDVTLFLHELEQSFEEEGRTGAASDIVKVTDWGF